MNPTNNQALGILVGMITSEKLQMTEETKNLINKNIGTILSMMEKDLEMNWRANYSNIVS